MTAGLWHYIICSLRSTRLPVDNSQHAAYEACGAAAEFRRHTHLAIFQYRAVLYKISLWSLFHRFHSFQPVETNLEKLVAWQVQILYVDSCPQQMLDGWPPGQKGTSTSGRLPILRPSWRNTWAPADRLCFFPRHVWFTILQGFGLQDLAPQVAELSFDFEDWWANISRRVSGQGKKGLNSIIILGAWSLWNLRNRCVFDGINPSFPSIVSVINEELLQWSFAGAREFLFSSPKRLQALWCMVLCSWSSQVLFLRVR